MEQMKQIILSVMDSYIFKEKSFYKNLMSDWGKKDVYGPWINIKFDGKLHFYKNYYFITSNGKPNIDKISNDYKI